jgi:hypothetical protein
MGAAEMRCPPRRNAEGQSVAQSLGNTDSYSPTDWRAQRLARRFAVSAHVGALLLALAFTTTRGRV